MRFKNHQTTSQSSKRFLLRLQLFGKIFTVICDRTANFFTGFCEFLSLDLNAFSLWIHDHTKVANPVNVQVTV